MPEVFEYGVGYVEDLGAWMALPPGNTSLVKGLAVKVWDADGNPLANQNINRLKGGAMRELRLRGHSVGAWACPRRAPEASAQEVSRLYGDLGLSFCVWETEWEYKTDGGGVDVARLLTPWRQLRPRAYSAVATEGMVPETFNHAAAIAAHCRYLPETYQHLGPRYYPETAFQKAVALGWAPSRIHPTASGVESDDMYESLLRVYRARAAGFTRGVGLWRADLFNARDFEALRVVAGDLILA